MNSAPDWIATAGPRQLGIMARPRGDDWLVDDIRALQGAGVDAVVSLLTSAEVRELGLSHEESLCEAAGLGFRSFPIADRQVPASMHQANILIGEINQALLSGHHIVIHCRAGIGRAALVAASVLVIGGHTATAALRATEAARGCPVPDTAEQAAWVEAFAAFQRRASDDPLSDAKQT